MAKPINLTHERKARAKASSAAQAAENRIRFGRTKAERQAQERAMERLQSAVEAHRLPDDESLFRASGHRCSAEKGSNSDF